jgi:hypothetical protein
VYCGAGGLAAGKAPFVSLSTIGHNVNVRIAAVCLAAWTVLTLRPAAAQQALNVEVVEGEGAINNVRQRTAREPIVQVTDENHKPVAGAVVVFTLPMTGAGGTFTGGAQTLTVLTNAQGRAIATGLHVNKVAGAWQMHVNASFAGHSATTVIAQTNAAAAAAGAGAAGATAGIISGKVIAIVAVAAGVAAGGAVAATHAASGGGGGGNNGGSTPGPPGGGASGTTITIGGGSVGAPK